MTAPDPTSPEGIAHVDAIMRRIATRNPAATATVNGHDARAAGAVGRDPYGDPYGDPHGDDPQPEPDQASPPPPTDPEPEGKPGRPSQATELVGLARARYDVGISTTGEPFAVAKPGHGPHLARMLRGGRTSLRAELAARYAQVHRRAASSSALADALLVLEGLAGQQPPAPLGLRVARTRDGALVLDLGDPTGTAAVIAPERWELVDRAPVLFRRTNLTGTLPVPTRGGRLDTLREVVNVSDAAWPLVLAWLIAALIPELDHPMTLVTGEQGVGKSTTAELLSRLVDPSPAPLRAPPKDLEQWAVAAYGSWIVALDNLSVVPEWLSDVLCRAVTGEGLVRRTHYEMNDVTVITFRRAILLTTIDPGAIRGDLANRLLLLDLDRPATLRDREELHAAFDAAHPTLLGALLDLTAGVLATLPSVRVPDPPRLVGFARILAAVDALLGTSGLATYRELTTRIAAEVADGDQVARPVMAFLAEHGAWQGTAGELYAKLTAALPDGRRPDGWPKSPRGMTGALKRAAPTLRQLGYGVDGPRRREWSLWAAGHQPPTLLDPEPDASGGGETPGSS